MRGKTELRLTVVRPDWHTTDNLSDTDETTITVYCWDLTVNEVREMFRCLLAGAGYVLPDDGETRRRQSRPRYAPPPPWRYGYEDNKEVGE